jgi:hypothetical protein
MELSISLVCSVFSLVPFRHTSRACSPLPRRGEKKKVRFLGLTFSKRDKATSGPNGQTRWDIQQSQTSKHDDASAKFLTGKKKKGKKSIFFFESGVCLIIIIIINLQVQQQQCSICIPFSSRFTSYQKQKTMFQKTHGMGVLLTPSLVLFPQNSV